MTPLSFIEFVEDVLGLRFEPGQRVFWQVAADGVQPCDLSEADRAIAAELFGSDVDQIPADCRRHVAVIKGADVGFSFFGGLRLLHRALTAHGVAALGAAGEIRPALCVAPDLRTGRIPIRNALGAAESVPAIRRLIVKQGTDGFVIKRELGRFTSVECLPASVGGSSLRGRRYLEILFDEAAFFRGSDFAVNDVDCRRAVITRCLGQFWNGSTPWLETSDVWKTFAANWNAPATALAARIPTLLVRTDPRVVELVAAEQERDPEAAKTEYFCEPPAGSGGCYFDSFAVKQCAVDSMPLTLPPVAGARDAAGFDPAFQRDACAGAIVRRVGEIFEVCEIFELRPERGAPLVPSQTVKEFARLAKGYAVGKVASDIHYQEAVKEWLVEEGLRFQAAPGGNAGKGEVYGFAREMVHAGRVKWSAGHRTLTQQILEVIARPLPAGLVSITSPRRRGSHGDVASAFCLALWSCGHGPTPWDQLAQWQKFNRIHGCEILLGYTQPMRPLEKQEIGNDCGSVLRRING
ncbi:MAG TPA: hypothetical protein VJN18_25135 [Polyangiaceae bacterium]|nr:hypothetical protein [Polyangiaceae bacterium]